MTDFPHIPGYRIERELGSGGMATVYLGVQERLKRNVAIKMLHPVLTVDRQFAERFLKEAETSARLAHPGIVTIHDLGQSGSSFYIVMEYLPESLRERMKRGVVPPDEALGIIRQVSGALDYAHGEGYIHRDIKPENVMFRKDGTVVIVDFGIARAVDAATRLTKTGMSIGTPHYMSPEQARGKTLDGRSDYYALGIILYEMLTGHVPYDAPDSVAVAIQHIQKPIPQLPPHLSRYQPLLERMMAKTPEERVGNSKELSRLEAEIERDSADNLTVSLPEPGTKVEILEEDLSEESELGFKSESKHPGRDKTIKWTADQKRTGADILDRYTEARSRLEKRKRPFPVPVLVGSLVIAVVALIIVLSIGKANRVKEREYRGYLSQAHVQLEKGNLTEARRQANLAETIKKASVDVRSLQKVILNAEEERRAHEKMKEQRRLAEEKARQDEQIRQAELAEKQKQAEEIKTSDVLEKQKTWREAETGMEFVWIPAGEFDMGSNKGRKDESPVHRVRITKGFWMGKYEVTQGQWQAIMGTNPSHFKKGDHYPVESVSWDDVQEFIKRINGRTRYVFRLPTEAEWEYACLAGTSGERYGNLDDIGWYERNSGGSTRMVGQKTPNAFGLYDMIGNVWERCLDWHDPDYYRQSPMNDPQGPSSGTRRVLRGGSWNRSPDRVRAAYRGVDPPSHSADNLGLRLVREN